MPASRSWIRPAILTFAAIAPIWTIFWFRSDWVVALIPLFTSHMLLLYATLVPQSQWWGPVIRAFETSQREVWITIDDGPTPAHTRKILETLERHRARATFLSSVRVQRMRQILSKKSCDAATQWRITLSHIRAEVSGVLDRHESRTKSIDVAKLSTEIQIGSIRFFARPPD